jgi:hypothetical protein
MLRVKKIQPAHQLQRKPERFERDIHYFRKFEQIFTQLSGSFFLMKSKLEFFLCFGQRYYLWFFPSNRSQKRGLVENLRI